MQVYRITAIIFLAVSLLWVAPFAGADNSLDPGLLKKLNRHYGALDSFSGRYVQESVTQALGGPQPISMTETAKGTMYFQKPGYFLMIQEEPRAERIVVNWEATWWWIPEENKAYRYPSQSRSGVIKALEGLLVGEERLEDSFRLALLGEDASTYTVRLDPRKRSGDYEHLEATLSKNTLELRALKLYYPLGQDVLFTFVSVRENPRFEDDFFEFSPPSGAQVIQNP